MSEVISSAKSCVIGLGEVGNSIYNYLYKKDNIRLDAHDPKVGRTADFSESNIFHICVPADQVEKVVQPHGLNIIHSTVYPGTTRKLSEKGYTCVHSPIVGKHPNLQQSFYKFYHVLGATDPNIAQWALMYYHFIDLTADIWPNPETTELAKIMCTTRLGWEIIFMRHLHDLCKKFGADFDKVHTDWTDRYNLLYDGMGDKHFHRSILKAIEGENYGHCMPSNAELMKFDSYIASCVATECMTGWNKKDGRYPKEVK
jgi:hypothetical protein